MNGIFISYRRQDTSPYAGRIFDALTREFPLTRVFMDFSGIDPGEDFVKRIEEEVQGCDVLLAIIGKKWLSIVDSAGNRRLENSDDWVRKEILAALTRNIRVIPCLVGQAKMPHKQELPQALHTFARRQGLELTDARFHSDMSILINTLSKIIKRGAKKGKLVNPVPSDQGRTKKRFDRNGEMVKVVLPDRRSGRLDSKSPKFHSEKMIWLDIYPVTNRAYAKFVQENGYSIKSFWSNDGWRWRKKNAVMFPAFWKQSKWNQPDCPVVGVSYYEADAYAKWAGKRLPVESEWEWAALGGKGYTYPWGSHFSSIYCNSKEGRKSQTTAVYSHPLGASLTGCYDLVGNVWEWCDSWWTREKDMRVIRGGSWRDSAKMLRISRRERSWPTGRKNNIGFRCAKDCP
ncbi:MAG: SUMF1/EgtB/PvdO family nonheme iron enzyme [Nitrospirota bacterium]|nr:SUMF1/EgtB/PvdO family nonheme iron enzyme [Nitrospinota bacterium]MDH5586960.1 SUMF1/EgtB/PvdO family nonheme iron enzyme [Nitrospirota bacterium]MDH5774079.1 SUMF1/EgtB/PvdO family nonheme iron enzyme [Nitrospirota bacterium]